MRTAPNLLKSCQPPSRHHHHRRSLAPNRIDSSIQYYALYCYISQSCRTPISPVPVMGWPLVRAPTASTARRQSSTTSLVPFFIAPTPGSSFCDSLSIRRSRNLARKELEPVSHPLIYTIPEKKRFGERKREREADTVRHKHITHLKSNQKHKNHNQLDQKRRKSFTNC